MAVRGSAVFGTSVSASFVRLRLTQICTRVFVFAVSLWLIFIFYLCHLSALDRPSLQRLPRSPHSKNISDF